ncbi:hypothetical protein CEXT_651071 [Caerostris extrusa]|uniref:Uncharacterized protein n=1 Tax=Caerostris extrusa TaxID=172846 RepID=A0AAV4T839_CAEEX|nr:hypothetical protein CEXT_651071 [Caerostris extrusa]
MPARRPTTISEVPDKEGRLRAMMRRHHNEWGAVTPFVHPSTPLSVPLLPCPPLEFHNAAAACTGETSLLRPSFTHKDKRPFIFKYYIDVEAHTCVRLTI